MKGFFKFTFRKFTWFLIVFVILNYFMPLFSPVYGDTGVSEHGLPLPFFKVYVSLFSIRLSSEVKQIFNITNLLLDIIFAYISASFIVFTIKKYRESRSLAFKVILWVLFSLGILVIFLRMYYNQIFQF